ncbi:hypothetical protein P885DRAFT_77982 [Corynascus similis CBS 632.67]
MPPPIPFPYPLRIGTDICRVARIAHILRSKQGARFIRRVLAPEELACARPAIHQVLKAAGARRGGMDGLITGQAGRRADGDVRVDRHENDGEKRIGIDGRDVGGVGQEPKTESEEQAMYGRAATYMAGRFAAKEAAFKAHPHLRLGFHDIVILSSADAEELTGEKAPAGPGASAPVALIRAGNGGASRDQMARVSISHDGEYATAMCIGFEVDAEG